MRIKTFTIPVFFAFIFLFASCAKLPVYKSKTYTQSENNDFLNPLSANFDKKNNIRFDVSDNDTNLFLQFVFHDQLSLMKIMRGGLNLYFDPQGKKNKNYLLKIEKSEVKQTEFNFLSRQMKSESGNGQQNMAGNIGASFNKITWDKNGKQFVFYSNLVKDPISVKLSINKHNELILDVKMPLSEIAITEKENLLSIGLETNSVSMGGMSSGRSSGSMRSSSSGGSRMGSSGGGMRSGGMGGRSGGGGGKSTGNSRSSGGSSPSGMEPIRIWFQIQIQ
ncbi:MAG: hypothetical protein HQ541_23605 [Mariniphaga sp.]|nr:hypothetical protein [Mariniphaga sp.]